MPNGFNFYRVFCSTPGILDEEREAFLETLAAVNENFAMPSKRLFVPVVCLGAVNTGAYNGAVRENVRDADFFIQILGHTWGVESAEFEDLFDYAVECRDNPQLRMRQVAVFLKQLPANKLKSAVSEFRRRVSGDPFTGLDELKSKLTSLLQDWLSRLPPGPPSISPPSPTSAETR
jgi:hypothetical protein